MTEASKKIDIEQIRNGIWVRAPRPQCWWMQVQWIDGDQWVLLSEDQTAMHGGRCRMAHQVEFASGFKVLMTKAELCEYLNRLPWEIDD